MIETMVAMSANSVRLAGGALRFFAPAAGGATRIATRRTVLATVPFLGPHAAAVVAVAGVGLTAYELYRFGRWYLT